MELEKQLEQVMYFTEKRNIAMLEGEVSTDSIIDLSENSLEAFLESIERVKPEILVLSKLRYQIEEIQEKHEKYNKYLELVEKRKSKGLLKMLESQIWKILSYQVCFSYSGVTYKYMQIADWYETEIELNELLDEGQSNHRFEFFTQKNEELLIYAEKIANFPLFQKATNQSQREFAVMKYKKSFPSDEERKFRDKEIIEIGQSIFKLEVEPRLLKEKKDEAQKLYKDGFSQNRIMTKLDLPKVLIYSWIEELEDDD